MKGSLPSPKQKALLDFIGAFIARENYAPSYREVMRALDYKSVSTVATHVNGLIERGWLVKRENAKRSLEVVYREEGMQTATSPAPTALPVAHEAWLQAAVADALARSQRPDQDRETLRQALKILGIEADPPLQPDE